MITKKLHDAYEGVMEFFISMGKIHASASGGIPADCRNALAFRPRRARRVCTSGGSQKFSQGEFIPRESPQEAEGLLPAFPELLLREERPPPVCPPELLLQALQSAPLPALLPRASEGRLQVNCRR